VNKTTLLLVAVATWVTLAASLSGQETGPYDLILRNGRIVDGTGSPWFRGDVAIRDGVIAAVGRAVDGSALREIDVSGQVISPGFVDVHSHGDRLILEVPTAENYVREGVTTIVTGPDGSSVVPLGPWLDSVSAAPTTINVASMVGQGSIRAEVVGMEDRPATAEEMDRMRALAGQAMYDGAVGLSTGLFYTPGAFSPTEEVIELAKVVGRLGGIHQSHMRDEASRIVESVLETIRIGEEGGLPTQITHHKVVGAGYWGASRETLRLVDEARARGVDVTIDQYPYTASATSIQDALLPAWALEGESSALQERLADPAQRARMRDASARIIELERGGGDPSRVVISSCPWDATLAGKTLRDVMELRGLENSFHGAADAAMWITEQGGCGGIFHAMDEEDVVRIMRHPATMIADDGGIMVPGVGHPHPRSYGTFARVLAEYVRERGVLTLEEAVRKMSAFPAERMGFHDRGLLMPGMAADIAVFDPVLVRDPATFDEPHHYSEGFSLVIVNGAVVLEGNSLTDARPGRVLYGPAHHR